MRSDQDCKGKRGTSSWCDSHRESRLLLRGNGFLDAALAGTLELSQRNVFIRLALQASSRASSATCLVALPAIRMSAHGEGADRDFTELAAALFPGLANVRAYSRGSCRFVRILKFKTVTWTMKSTIKPYDYLITSSLSRIFLLFTNARMARFPGEQLLAISQHGVASRSCG